MKHVLSLQRVSARLLSTIALLAATVMSCDDEETINPVAIQFTTANLTVSEAAGEQTVNLTLASGAPADATVEINVENTNVAYATDYTTNPNGSTGKITIAITKGQTSAQFKFTPVNNSLLADVVKSVTFTVGTVTGPIENGTTASFIVTITDDEGPSAINFETSSSNTSEGNVDGLDINLPLSAAAPGAGQVVVNIASTDAVYGTHYTTQPEAVDGKVTLQISVDDATEVIKVIPIDNTDVNAARVLTFTIESAGNAVQLGTNVTHTFTINDDETPSTVAFEAAEGSMSEGLAEGANVVVNLTPVANAAGTLEISFTSENATYGTHFTTDPAATDGKLTLNIESGAGSASFKIIPVNNTDVNESRVINFSMSASTGIVIFENGAANTLYTHTITDDDAVTTITDVRGLYQGANLDITNSLRIRGVVISSNPQVNTNNIWVQDATAGIVVRFAAANNNTIKRGDEVFVELNGGQMTVFNGLLQVQNVPNANVTLIDEGNTLPAPQVVTVTEFNTGNYEGKLVRINDVGFVDADGTLTMSGSRTVSDGTNTTTVRTESGASFSGTAMPLGIGAVTGLAGEFNSASQLIPIVFEEDVFASSAIGTIGTSGTLNDFSSVNKDAESTSQQYTVQGTTLSKDIVITASANFKVSLDDATFGTTVTVTAANANNTTTVYVRFAPTTGSDQVITGNIKHSSLGAAPVVLQVSGTESGNNLTPLQTLALWTFETSAPVLANATTISGIVAESGVNAASSTASGVHTSAETDYSSPAGNGSTKSFSSNTWAIGDYYQFVVSTTGFSDIAISWDQTGSSTGPSDFELQYSTDGSNFTSLPSYAVVKSTGTNIIFEDASTGGGWSTTKVATNTSKSYDFSDVTALDNVASVTFRIRCTTAPSATGGTGRIDNIKVEGR